MKYCMYCGAEMADEDLFCMQCGAKQKDVKVAKPLDATEAVESDKSSNKTSSKTDTKTDTKINTKTSNLKPLINSIINNKKLVKGVLCGIGAVLTVIVVALICSNISLPNKKAEAPEIQYTYLSKEPEINVEYEVTDNIFPLMYNRLDSIMEFSASTTGGEKEIEISAEIPGFTQKYEKKFKINEQITQFYIHPALLTGELDLDSGKQAQVNLVVSDTETGKIIVKDTASVYLKSMHDIPIGSSSTGWGYNAYDNFLSALTPEDDAIDTLIRKASDEMKRITTKEYGEEKATDSMYGYQDYGYGDPGYGTYYQLMALQLAMSDLGVKYIQSNYSSSETDVALQRIKLPADVLETQSGLCVETSVFIASALQELGMNAFLVMPPGHCQVAVEAWPKTGAYFILETTSLPTDLDSVYKIVGLYRAEKLESYIVNYNNNNDFCYVLDCGLAPALGFTKTNN